MATAPPATRLSTRSVLDTGTRPSAPESDADVIFSRAGLAAGQHLIDVHDRYRAELEQVRDLLARVDLGPVTEAIDLLTDMLLPPKESRAGPVQPIRR